MKLKPPKSHEKPEKKKYKPKPKLELDTSSKKITSMFKKVEKAMVVEPPENVTIENEHPVNNTVIITQPSGSGHPVDKTVIITQPSRSESDNPRDPGADSNPSTSESYEVKDDPKKEARFGKKISLSENP